VVRAQIIDRDLGWKDMTKAVAAMAGGAYAKVGVLADDSKGAEHVDDGGITVAELATVLEFGTEDKHIPARPFLRGTFDEKREELAGNAKTLIGKIIDREQTVKGALDVLGLKLATETKKTITDGAGVPPPNAPSTIEQKGSDRPLVDTGRLLNAITWAVEMGAK
jgi:hypothetical protein